MDPITATTSASTLTGQREVQNAVEELGSEVFLRLLVTQLQSQDPTNPTQNEDFVAQLAQFTTLEQATNTTDLLQQLVEQRSELDIVSLLGRDIVTEGDILSLDKSNEPVMSYVLEEDTRAIKAQILDKDGHIVRNLNVDQVQKAGSHEVVWDGLDDAGKRLAEGPYQISIQAVDARDQKVELTTFSLERVVSLLPGNASPIVVASGRTYNTDQVQAIR